MNYINLIDGSSTNHQAMFQLLYLLVHAIEPYWVPICFCLTWAFILLVGLTLWSTITHSVAVAKRMHQIPCTHCQFFTADYRLKCTVHPSVANTDAAINCSDYCPNNSRVSTTW